MPIRVRCSCGRELIVRHGEWLHAVLGLTILLTLVNGVALVFVTRDLRELDRRLETIAARASSETPEGSETKSVPSRTAGSPPARNARSVLSDSRSPASNGSGTEAVDSPKGRESPEGRETPENGATPDDSGAARDHGRPPEDAKERLDDGSSTIAPNLEPLESGPMRGSPSSGEDNDAEVAVERLLSELELIASNDRAEDPAKSSSASSARSWLELPRVARLLLLTRARDDPVVVAGFLIDPDPRLREFAAAWLERGVPLGNDGEIERREEDERAESSANTRASVAVFLTAAREFHSSSRIDTIERALAGKQDDARVEFATAWSQGEKSAQELARRAPDLWAHRSTLEKLESGIVDVALLIDSTESMDAVLPDVQSTLAWMLPALAWVGPQLRFGLVSYKDDVEEVVSLSPAPDRDIVPRILAIRASGGGDVPEGVHRAVSRGLLLGEFPWRDDADRHLVIIGDQIPPYDEIAPLESLAKSARSQGRYQLHALYPPGEDAVTAIFRDLARAGGGRSGGCLPSGFSKELVAIVLAIDDDALLDALVDALRAFSGARG
jgi:hypothetical protein